MTPVDWPCPLPGGSEAREYALTFDKGRENLVLIVPALLGEANLMRRFTVEVMRRLDGAGIDCVLPDLPGCNESLQSLEAQAIEDWHDAMSSAAVHFGATHALGIRGGCLFAPDALPGWHYAPVKGASLLRQMVRARILASREAGREEAREDLMAKGRGEGLELAGYRLGADLVSGLETLEPRSSQRVQEIGQDLLGGPGLWLRAEPDHDSAQADALAAIIAVGLAV